MKEHGPVSEETRSSIPPWVWMATLVIILGLVWAYRNQRLPFLSPKPAQTLRADIDTTNPELTAIAETLRKMEPQGPYISNILVEPGIRARSGEIPTPGEVKIMFNLQWHSLPGNPDLRQALDESAAGGVMTVMRHHPEVTKLRLVLKVPKRSFPWLGRSTGPAQGHESAAKVFSLTREAFETIESPTDARSILELGDYVVLTKKGWVSGF